MDFQLRCNHLRCRDRLKDKAVVTTCSHIFCLACSDSSTLGSGETATRSCPACSTTLDKPFDVTVAILRPTDDYKMSILSGLSPTIIMECANSGMAFWAYQSSQEIYYQEHANKSLKQQLDVKNQELSGVKVSARDEIGKLEESLQDASDKISKLTRSLAELEEGRKSLERDRNRFRTSYEKLKQKALVPDIEIAAEENAAYAAQSGEYGNMHLPRSRTGSDGSVGRRQGNDFFAAPNYNARHNVQSSSKCDQKPLVRIMTDLLVRIASANDAFRPPPTSSLRVWYSRISPRSRIHIVVGQPSRNTVSPTAGQCRAEYVRWRWIHHERHQDWEAAKRIHEPIRNEQQSPSRWHELSLTSEDDQKMTCRRICRKGTALHLDVADAFT